MNRKDLLTVGDMTRDEVLDILRLSRILKRTPFKKKKALTNKTLALLFQKPSNRTRISFEVAMTHLGGHAMYLSPQEIDMGGREPAKDVACVLSRYVDGIAARVFSHDDIVTLSHYADVPVINALSDLAHPCQALSDVFTIMEKFRGYRKTKLAYVGDGNNVLNSLMTACAKVGINIFIATPVGYEPSGDSLGKAKDDAKKRGSYVNITNDPKEAVSGAHVVYTDVWVSMGQEDEREKRLRDFEGFQVNNTLLREDAKDAMIMHCLPAHRGEEITDVIDGKSSIVYDQAENRMHVEKAILLKYLGRK